MAEQGQIGETELQQKLNEYRNSNNKNQIKDQFLRTASRTSITCRSREERRKIIT